jgi:GTP pyrophosphokinase
MDITSTQLDNALKPSETPPAQPIPSERRRRRGVARRIDEDEITIQGVRNLVTHIARCCHPQPGDPIVGFVTMSRGIAIHRQDCENILGLQVTRQNRLLDVAWGSDSARNTVNLEILAINRKGITKEVTQLLASNGLEILKIRNRSEVDSEKVLIEVNVAGTGSEMITRTLGELAELPDLLEIRKVEQDMLPARSIQ